MRIAILAPYAGYIAGGVETAAKGLRKQLLAEHECEIFSLSETDWTTRVPGIKGSTTFSLVRMLKLHHLNHLIPYVYVIKSNAFSELTYVFSLFSILKRFKPDIIINPNNSIVALFCQYFRRKFQVPFIHVGQSGCTYLEFKSALTKPDAFVALTPVAKQYIQERVPHLRVEVIPNGVDLDLFSSSGPRVSLDELTTRSENNRVQLKPPFILSTSRLVREKRLDLLIQAVSRLENGTLILVGHGEAKKRLMRFGQMVLKNRIVFLDTLSQEELAKLYRSCDVFSLPSKNEAFGNVIVEAMASGLPVVATNDKGFEWILAGKGGFLVDVTDPQAYANALQKASKTNFGDEPVKQAQNFSWQRVAQKYKNLIDNVINAKK